MFSSESKLVTILFKAFYRGVELSDHSSNHQLEIETGRYKKKVIDQRLCKICNENGCVEDEFHFLMTCKAYQTERNEFFTKLNAFIVPFESYTSQEQFLFLMSTNDTEVIMLLMHFIEICLQIRQSSGR